MAKEGVRVIRLLEYEYENVEAATEDMARWTISVGTNMNPIRHMRMRSATLPIEAIEWSKDGD